MRVRIGVGRYSTTPMPGGDWPPHVCSYVCPPSGVSSPMARANILLHMQEHVNARVTLRAFAPIPRLTAFNGRDPQPAVCISECLAALFTRIRSNRSRVVRTIKKVKQERLERVGNFLSQSVITQFMRCAFDKIDRLEGCELTLKIQSVFEQLS